MKATVQAENAPAPKGPYSPGVTVSDRVLYVSAQGPFDPKTGAVVGAVSYTHLTLPTSPYV